MPLFSRKKDKVKKENGLATNGSVVSKPRWEDAWLRTRVDPEEVAELLRGCTAEIKSRALDVPFLLLPFRPSSDPSAAKTFVRNYFFPPGDRKQLTGQTLTKELKMTEVMVIIAVMKWCWARLPGGVVTWEAYHGFRDGEKDSRYARNAFSTFIPLGVEVKARIQIINDYFDLLTALSAHGKTNGLGGYKLSRYAGWWAFEHFDTGKGFEAGYKLWNASANATCHLFFAYLRSQTPEPGSTNGILNLPRSVQQLLDSVDYPPQSSIIANDTTKVVMIVDVVSPTPFALLRRARQFEYRDDDMALQHFAEFEDPVQALSEECRRVLQAISTANQSHVSDAATSTSLKDPSWSRFEDIGFGSAFDETGNDTFSKGRNTVSQGLSSTSNSPANALNRPTTPSWADFLSSGFVDENGNRAPAPVLLPPDKAIPPMGNASRGQSSQSHRRDIDTNHLEPGELASIAKIELDDAFWWVWITSLAAEEPVARKAAFGRCAVIETTLLGGQWMVMEEQVKGAAPEPVPGAYVAERKSFFSFTKRSRLTRRRSALKKSPLADDSKMIDPSMRTTLDSDRKAKIQKAAAELARKKQGEDTQTNGVRRGRLDENAGAKTNSVFTLGPHIKDEASPAMQWAKQYDKKAIREQYLGNTLAGKGSRDFLSADSGSLNVKRSASTLSVNKDLPPAPARSAVPEHSNSVHSPGQEEVVKQDEVKHATPEIEPSNPISEQRTPLAETIPNIIERPVRSRSRSRSTDKAQPIVSETNVALSKQSEDSRRSGGSSRDKSMTDRSRLQKQQRADVPPPVATNKNGGIRKMFGTFRKHKDTENKFLSPNSSSTNEDPAIAAARRALEGQPARPGDGPISPPLSPSHFDKLRSSEKKTSPIPSSNSLSSDSPGIQTSKNFVEEKTKSSTYYAAVVEPAVTSTGASNHSNKPEEISTPYQTPFEESVPTKVGVHSADDFDDLSQVDSRERANAAHEFSRFDQGPLTDQPAFVPESHNDIQEYDDADAPQYESTHRPQHQSVYSNVTMQTDASDEELPTDAGNQISAHERWAQIRKNAAERAARASEDHQRSRTETRTTDDGETSGEETIESRVARIKARVAELTGNMEATRR